MDKKKLHDPKPREVLKSVGKIIRYANIKVRNDHDGKLTRKMREQILYLYLIKACEIQARVIREDDWLGNILRAEDLDL